MEENGTLRCCQYQRIRTETLTASWAIKIATGSSGHCRRYSIGQKGHAHRFCCHLEATVDSECAHQDRSDQPHSGVCGGNTESCGGSGARNNVTTQTAVQRRSSWKGRCWDDNSSVATPCCCNLNSGELGAMCVTTHSIAQC